MTKIDNKNLFYCYTRKLSSYLCSEGIEYILKARSIKDDSIFTLYQKSDELQQALDKFKVIQ
jgi:hypothetical protein